MKILGKYLSAKQNRKIGLNLGEDLHQPLKKSWLKMIKYSNLFGIIFKESILEAKRRKLHPYEEYEFALLLSNVHHRNHLLKDLEHETHKLQVVVESLRRIKEELESEN